MFRSFKERLANDEQLHLFAVGRLPHPVLIDMFGLAGGYDGFWIDNEHASMTSDQLVTATIAARANNFDTFVRVPPVGYWLVTQCLEAGAGGVMGAQVQSADHAREFLSWCKFAPEGVRGMNMGGRDANYSYLPPAEFAKEANEKHLVGIQIETPGAVQDVDEIASIEGVDMLFVGPVDLSLSLGVVGQFHHEKLWEAIDQVAAACAKHGKNWGCVAPDPKFADRAIEAGCRMPTLGNDVACLRRGVETLRSSFANQFPN